MGPMNALLRRFSDLAAEETGRELELQSQLAERRARLQAAVSAVMSRCGCAGDCRPQS